MLGAMKPESYLELQFMPMILKETDNELSIENLYKNLMLVPVNLYVEYLTTSNEKCLLKAMKVLLLIDEDETTLMKLRFETKEKDHP